MTFKYDFHYERLNGIIRICSALCILLTQIVLKATKNIFNYLSFLFLVIALISEITQECHTLFFLCDCELVEKRAS